MLFTRILLINIFSILVYSQVTKLSGENPLLSRKKRYLMFPMNSNFVIGMAYVKAFLRVQPRGWNALGELDFPFPLPSDTKLYKKIKRSHNIQKREILTGLDAAFTRSGLNGTACVKRMICDAEEYIQLEGKSLVKDILLTLFRSAEDDDFFRYNDPCDNSSFSECEMPFLSYILSSFFNE